MNCDHNTTLSNYEAHICVEHLHSVDQIRTDEGIKYNRNIVQSSKSGSRSILLYYASKSRRAQSSVQISINDSRRCNYARKRYERDISGIAAKIGDRSCSPAVISINAERTQPVEKTKGNRKRDREPSRISVRRVTKLLRRKKCRSRVKNLLKHNFPRSSFMRDFCSNYKKWFIWYNCEHFYCKYVFLINKQKGKKGCTYCTGKQADFSINTLQTKSDFSHHSVDHIFHSLNLKGGMLTANDNCNLPWACLNQRLSYISLTPYDVGGSGDCFFRSVSHQLYGTAELHFQIRTAGIRHLNNYPEFYIESVSDNSWQDYIQQMSRPGTWCDNIIIQAVANAHNCVIHITESDVNKPHGTIITPVLHEERPNTIFIGYINELHYVSTVPLKNSPNKTRLGYLKRKLKESDDQTEKRLAKRRNTRDAETDKQREIRLQKIRENVSKKRGTKTDDNRKEILICFINLISTWSTSAQYVWKHGPQ